MVDGDSRVSFGFEPFHIIEGNDLHFALHMRDVLEVGREGREELLLLLGHLVVGFVDGEVKIGGEGSVSPRFADLVVIAEGVVIAREHEDEDNRKEHKNTQTEYRFRVFGICDL